MTCGVFGHEQVFVNIFQLKWFSFSSVKMHKGPGRHFEAFFLLTQQIVCVILTETEAHSRQKSCFWVILFVGNVSVTLPFTKFTVFLSHSMTLGYFHFSYNRDINWVSQTNTFFYIVV